MNSLHQYNQDALHTLRILYVNNYLCIRKDHTCELNYDKGFLLKGTLQFEQKTRGFLNLIFLEYSNYNNYWVL